MFTIAFRDGADGELVYGVRPDYNDEYLRDSYKGINIHADIGETFMDFVSLTGDISGVYHPYVMLAEETDSISENAWFLVQLRKYLDLGIHNEAFFTLPCLMYFLELTGLQIPAVHHELMRKRDHEDDCLEDCIPQQDGADHFEHSMRAYLAGGAKIYDVPLTVYHCETIEDACIATLHFLITHKFNIRKCKNCGKYFVAYYRSDTVYCDRVSPYNKNKICKEDGPKRTFEASVDGDVVRKRLKQIETARRMRKSRNKGDRDIEKEFLEWKHAMDWKRKEYESGGISPEQFLTWLEAHKAYTEDWNYAENYQ